MALQHDKQGFLVGDLVSGQRDMLDQQQTGNGLLRGIRTEVRSIARALGAQSINSRASQSTGNGGSRASAQLRDAAGRFIASQSTQSPGRGMPAWVGKDKQLFGGGGGKPGRYWGEVMVPREKNGRFRSRGDAPKQPGDDPPGKNGGVISDRLGRIASAIKELAHGTEQVDPAISAMHEVKNVVAPLGRGMFAMLGRSAEKKKERWYNRLLAAITGKKSETGSVGVTAEGGSGLGSVLSGAARFLPLLLTGAMGMLGSGLAFLVGTKIGGAIYEWLDKSGIASKVFDAFDAAVDWIKDKVNKGKQAFQQFDEARNLAREGLGTKGQVVLGGSGRNMNDPRRAATDLPSLADGPTTIPQKLGRIIGSAQNGADYMKGAGGKSRRQLAAERKAILERQADAAGITDPKERAAFMAQMHWESAGFSAMEERASGKQYEGRKDLGNVNPGDGALFKGRGFTGLTGRSNYRDMGKQLGLDLEGNPELAADPDVAARIATTFWQQRSRAAKFGGGRISDLARAGNIDGVTQGLNGGMNGAAGRSSLYTKYLATTAGTMSLQSTGIPSASPDRIPPAASVEFPSASGSDKDRPVRAVLREPIGQDVGDRRIAHIVTGGIGG